MSTFRIVSAIGVIAVLTAACSKSNDGGSAPPSTVATSESTTTSASSSDDNGMAAVGAAQAKVIFQSRCSTCHGNEGRGDGPGAIALNPKPRNYHDKDWQTKVTDEDIKKVIVYGGAAVGKSPNMPANPDLDSKPQVVDALVHIVRDFGK